MAPSENEFDTPALEGLQPIIEKFVTHGLLVPCQSPYNTPILLVLKLTGEYGLVQDLRLFSEAAVPLHPLVAKAYTILTKVPVYAQWYTILNLKKMPSFASPSTQIPDTYLHLSGQTPKR